MRTWSPARSAPRASIDSIVGSKCGRASIARGLRAVAVRHWSPLVPSPPEAWFETCRFESRARRSACRCFGRVLAARVALASSRTPVLGSASDRGQRQSARTREAPAFRSTEVGRSVERGSRRGAKAGVRIAARPGSSGSIRRWRRSPTSSRRSCRRRRTSSSWGNTISSMSLPVQATATANQRARQSLEREVAKGEHWPPVLPGPAAATLRDCWRPSRS